MVFIKHNSLKSGIFFNPIFNPGFSGSRFFRVQVFQGSGFSGSRFFRVWVLGPGPGYGSRVQSLGSGSRVRVQGPGSRVQVPGPAFRSSPTSGKRVIFWEKNGIN